MTTADYTARYSALLAELTQIHGTERAMELVVGGDYLEQGALQRDLLLTVGLRPEHTIIDVGCGTGRLAFALRESHRGKYIGTDVLAPALEFAAARANRPDWQFIRTEASQIPAADDAADVVCLFSVLTHIVDEDCFRLLAEAKRTAKPGGTIVFSFLDFEVSWHWPIFEESLAAAKPEGVLNRFLSKAAIRVWCSVLNLDVERMIDGPVRWIGLGDAPRRRFGQSVCVVRVPVDANGQKSGTSPISVAVERIGLKHHSAD